MERKETETKKHEDKEKDSLYRDLYRAAAEAMKNAYAPFSEFRVGAALLAADGRIFTGVNVENASYGATICAERTAFVKAVSEGARDFLAIAVACSRGAAWPCGICRQFMHEFGGELDVITGPSADRLTVYQLKELMPEGFRL